MSRQNSHLPIDGDEWKKWTQEIPEDQWEVYQRVINQAQERDIPFSLGGAFAVATYTGRWRATKDLDLYVLPRDREKMVAAISAAGLSDYYEKNPYDRGWIYRSYSDGQIVDAIWTMANYTIQVDETWIAGGPVIDVRGYELHIAPPEEMIFGKIFIVQHDRCDWPEIMNMIYFTGPNLDWEHLLARLGLQTPVLAGVLSLFGWLSPQKAREFPVWLWDRLGLRRPEGELTPEERRFRANLIDSRPWYIPTLKDGEQWQA
jgi:hypothetical protein